MEWARLHTWGGKPPMEFPAKAYGPWPKTPRAFGSLRHFARLRLAVARGRGRALAACFLRNATNPLFVALNTQRQLA